MKLSQSWEAKSCSVTQETPSMLWKPRYITVITSTHYWFLSWARWIQSTPSSSTSLIINFNNNLTFTSLFPVVFSLQVFSVILHMHCSSSPSVQHVHPLHLPWPYHSNNIWWWVLHPSLWNFIQPPITSSLSNLNILLTTLFSIALPFLFL
jgi:hypothetical protein